MDRNHIIINHNDFFKPLILGLKERGLEPIFDQWQPETELLQKSLACFIWFYDALRHPIQVLALKLQLQRYGVPLVAWNRDAPHYLNRKPWRLNLIDRFKLFDIYATHTLIDTKRKFAGMQLFLPNAANTELYNLGGPVTEVFNRLRQEKNYRYDISFFGGMDGNRYKEDLDRQLFFEALAKRLDEIGVHYKFVETGDKGIPLKEQIDLIQSSKINLNYGARCEYQAPIASGLPERFFGIPACGGFLLGDRRIHTNDSFEIGVHLDDFSNLDECVEKIEYYLVHFEQSRKMAEQAYRHVLKHHTYTHRAATLHQALMDWHKGKRGLIR